MKLIGMIADHPTPKIKVGGGTAYTLNSRDYKGVMLVVISESDRGRFVQPMCNWIYRKDNSNSERWVERTHSSGADREDGTT